MGSLTSKDAALSRRECLSRLSTARPDVCSTCPREPSVLSSTREFVARSCPRGSTSGLSTPSTASQEGLPRQSSRQRGQEEGGQGIWTEGSSLQEVPCRAQVCSSCVH